MAPVWTKKWQMQYVGSYRLNGLQYRDRKMLPWKMWLLSDGKSHEHSHQQQYQFGWRLLLLDSLKEGEQHVRSPTNDCFGRFSSHSDRREMACISTSHVLQSTTITCLYQGTPNPINRKKGSLWLRSISIWTTHFFANVNFNKASFAIHLTMGQEHRNLAIMSDCMEHTTSFVYRTQRILVQFIKKNFSSVKNIHYLKAVLRSIFFIFLVVVPVLTSRIMPTF